MFKGPAGFEWTTFESWAKFDSATFEHEADFHKTTFKGWADFHSTFKDQALFDEAIFQRAAGFDGTTFEGSADFERVSFQDRAGFYQTTFKDRAGFNRTTFANAASFRKAAFKERADFRRASFRDEARFEEAIFEHTAEFNAATFETAQQIGPILVRRQLVLDGATFKERAQVEAAAATLCARQARFLLGVQLRLRWAQIILDDADLAAPSILAGAPAFADLTEGRFARLWERLLPAPRVELQWRSQPRLLSLRRADVAGLTVSNVDLRACQFAGAFNLDRLRMETAGAFAHTPSGWRWTARQTLAEEQRWRLERVSAPGSSVALAEADTSPTQPVHLGSGWYPPSCQPPSWYSTSEPLTAGQVAALYRDLRKGREDNKDEPGAADFYYGEMEMRRHAKRADAQSELQRRHYGPWAAATTESAVLWLYWLLSGYALRAWRALAALAILLILFAVLCAYGGGFSSSTASTSQAVTTAAATSRTQTTTSTTSVPAVASTPTKTPTADTTFGGALIYGARTVISLASDPQPRLTRWGEVLQILLRVMAPVLLGLAILSVRGRVKR
jgi:hypothetical protein